eukprot:15330457-Heterocapsa_arctica.AAC.1
MSEGSMSKLRRAQVGVAAGASGLARSLGVVGRVLELVVRGSPPQGVSPTHGHTKAHMEAGLPWGILCEEQVMVGAEVVRGGRSEPREGGCSACAGRPYHGRRWYVRGRECWDGDSARRASGARSAR